MVVANCRILFALLFTLVAEPASAQLFGPKNYEECMLEKMKGQAANMAGIARAACLRTFPQEVELSEPEATSTWCEASDNSISACVVLKDGYKITKAAGSFVRAACGSGEINFFSADENATAAPPMFGSTYKFLLKDARSYKCARFTFYGHKKG